MKVGWQINRLADVCNVFTDGDWIETKDQSPSGFRLLQTGNVGIGAFKDNRERSRHVSPSTFDRLRCTEVFAGDCLISRLPEPVGRSCLIPPAHEKAITAVDCTIVRFDRTRIDPQFFVYYSQTNDYVRAVDRASTGATRKRISRKNLGAIQFPVPPLGEQQRIVAILDEAFAGIAIAKTNAEKNLRNAQAIYDGQLQAAFTKNRDGWVSKHLGDVARINYGYTQSAKTDAIGPKFLRITDIQDNRVDWSNVPYCPITSSDLPKYQLAHGDIVFARTGATTGKSYLICNPPQAVFASYLIRARFDTDELLPKFVNLFFQTDVYWATIRSGVSGSAQGGFNASKLRDLSIRFPNHKSEQESIISTCEVLAVETDRLRSSCLSRIMMLDELKDSVLNQAFAGQL